MVACSSSWKLRAWMKSATIDNVSHPLKLSEEFRGNMELDGQLIIRLLAALSPSAHLASMGEATKETNFSKYFRLVDTMSMTDGQWAAALPLPRALLPLNELPPQRKVVYVWVCVSTIYLKYK
ncbi:Uncharacterized protein HZ326_21426 [Fusarium oxysporum f. sp. albedinis]|nr:Uncharacterized protein HZ326_28225 [Fusarium oxysporum f. sp. albedinis]KAJ0135563.1 Uncharacterized protein HZ326_21426 [Fusarium oxysporum f. sp. albedinis]